MDQRNRYLRVLGPILGVLLLYYFINAASGYLQTGRQELREIRATELAAPAVEQLESVDAPENSSESETVTASDTLTVTASDTLTDTASSDEPSSDTDANASSDEVTSTQAITDSETITTTAPLTPSQSITAATTITGSEIISP